MTVAELIEKLAKLPGENPVIVSIGYEGSFHVEQATANTIVTRNDADGKFVVIGGVLS